MINVIDMGTNSYGVEFDVVEQQAISKIAMGFSLNNCTALAAVISKGITCYIDQLKEIAMHESIKRQEEHTGES